MHALNGKSAMLAKTKIVGANILRMGLFLLLACPAYGAISTSRESDSEGFALRRASEASAVIDAAKQPCLIELDYPTLIQDQILVKVCTDNRHRNNRCSKQGQRNGEIFGATIWIGGPVISQFL